MPMPMVRIPVAIINRVVFPWFRGRTTGCLRRGRTGMPVPVTFVPMPVINRIILPRLGARGGCHGRSSGGAWGCRGRCAVSRTDHQQEGCQQENGRPGQQEVMGAAKDNFVFMLRRLAVGCLGHDPDYMMKLCPGESGSRFFPERRRGILIRPAFQMPAQEIQRHHHGNEQTQPDGTGSHVAIHQGIS